ncbi:glutamic acid-rich protein-like [Chironomus tepperi]|uniref:glutamic acid-rich protein-like n=1 Tax=Chironomus tepperi TaxID=113505 RepID=UPI00391F18AF
METEDIKDVKLICHAVEPIRKINQATHKTVVVVGKEHFLMCKQLMQDNAADDDFAILLNIPSHKVRYFKHKMQLFEDKIRARRRAAKLNKRRRRRRKTKPEANINRYVRKKEMSAEERFKYARELILENYSTSEISKVLRVSERSVTRFRKRLKEQKKKLQEEGKLEVDPEEEQEEYKFKFLSADVKAEKIAELYAKGMAATEIAEELKISDRSVRRWKIRLDEMKKNPEKYKKQIKKEKKEEQPRPEPKKQYLKSLDREIIERAKASFERGDTNKDMCALLDLPMNTIKKLTKMISNGTIDTLIDDTLELLAAKGRGKLVKPEDVPKKRIKVEEKVVKKEIPIKKEVKKEVKKVEDDDDFWNDDPWNDDDDEDENEDESSDDDNLPLSRLKQDSFDDSFSPEKVKEERNVVQEVDDADPLDPLSCVIIEESPTKPKPVSREVPRKPKTTLGKREICIAKCLRDKEIRTMDIAMLMNISERSASRLIHKGKDLNEDDIDQEILDHVDNLIENREELIGKRPTPAVQVVHEPKVQDDSKKKTAFRMLAMNVRPKDIAKILNVSESTVKRWKEKMETENTPGEHEIFSNLFAIKQEPLYGEEDDGIY